MADETNQQAPQDPLIMAMEMLIDTLSHMPKSALDPQKSSAAQNMILLAGAMAQVESARALRTIVEHLDHAKR